MFLFSSKGPGGNGNLFESYLVDLSGRSSSPMDFQNLWPSILRFNSGKQKWCENRLAWELENTLLFVEPTFWQSWVETRNKWKRGWEKSGNKSPFGLHVIISSRFFCDPNLIMCKVAATNRFLNANHQIGSFTVRQPNILSILFPS